MNLWQEFNKRNKSDTGNAGMAIRYDKGIDSEIKQKYADFVCWLKSNYIFPVRLNVYIINEERIPLKNGKMVYGKFSWYTKKTPVIKIPSAIDEKLFDEFKKEEIHEQILSSLVHELTHYYQWVKNLNQSDAVSERQANYYRYRIIDEYYEKSKITSKFSLYYVYILRCEDNSLYTGITTDVARRFSEHQADKVKGAKYTKAHKPKEIAAAWEVGTKSDASKLEYRIKKLEKSEKEKLILNKAELSEICGIQITVAKL